MAFTVTNRRNDSQFETNAGETILDAALRDNRIFPYGCRSGVCGACKSSLVGGRVDYGEYEEFTLSDDEIAEGKVLLCQAVPLEDVVIDVEEILTGQNIQIRMLPCRISGLNRLAEDVMQVYLTLPKSQSFNFIAGQYIDIVLKDGHRRSFSIANLPRDAGEEGLELHIRRVDNGHFTPRVFNSLRERDLLRLEGPFGTYFLQSDTSRPLIMIAGGTGFSPVKGLIQQALSNSPDQEIHLFWGARDEQDLYMNDLAREWASSHANFSYIPVLSESGNSGWKGATGWVHETVAETFANFSDFDIYASGPPVMIDAVRDSLSKKGLQNDRFFFDSFDYQPHP